MMRTPPVPGNLHLALGRNYKPITKYCKGKPSRPLTPSLLPQAVALRRTTVFKGKSLGPAKYPLLPLLNSSCFWVVVLLPVTWFQPLCELDQEPQKSCWSLKTNYKFVVHIWQSKAARAHKLFLIFCSHLTLPRSSLWGSELVQFRSDRMSVSPCP